jgi:hypothetical protein
MNAKQFSSRSTVKKTGTKSAYITGKHKNLVMYMLVPAV